MKTFVEKVGGTLLGGLALYGAYELSKKDCVRGPIEKALGKLKKKSVTVDTVSEEEADSKLSNQ